MRNIVEKHKSHWADRSFLFSSLAGSAFLIASLILNYIAGNYATLRAGNSVSDIILDNIPTVNVDVIFIEGAILLWIFVGILALKEPKRIPFLLKSVSLFIVIRSIFISLTHIGPFPDQILIEPNMILKKLTFGADLFFSGHTGFPFLMALAFWNNKHLRLIFLASSLIFGVSVLLGHLHYSIDVFAAFFITYGIFEMAKNFFKKD